MVAKFDERDSEILAERLAQRDLIEGPRIGDFVIFSNGYQGRFSHDWGDRIQWSNGGSFYLNEAGFASFSGGLYEGLDKRDLYLTKEMRQGGFWFFHHDYTQAHNGVDCLGQCRVYVFNGQVPQGAMDNGQQH